DFLLSDPGRRSGHRFPDADLWIHGGARTIPDEPVLLGNQPKPGRDDRARLVLEDRTAGGWRISVRARAGVTGQHPAVAARRARDDVRASERHTSRVSRQP